MKRVYFDVNIDEEAEHYAGHIDGALEMFRILRAGKETLEVHIVDITPEVKP